MSTRRELAAAVLQCDGRAGVTSAVCVAAVATATLIGCIAVVTLTLIGCQ